MPARAATMNESGRGPVRLCRSHAYKVLENGQVEIRDLDFAGYCHLRGLVLADAIQVGSRRPAEYQIFFVDLEGDVAKLAIDYTNSESARFAEAIRRLKKVIRTEER